MRRTGRRTRRGVALMDALIGGVLLGIGITALLSLSSRSISMQRDGERRLQAAWLADELMNTILVEGPDDYSKQFAASGRFDPPFEDFRYESRIDFQGERLPHEVTVTVTWLGGGGARRVVLDAEIAERKGEEARLDADPEISRRPRETLDRQQRWEEKLNPEEFADDPDDTP